MENLLHIRLRAVSPDHKVDREYIIEMGQDLFKHWYVTITFGRYQAKGTRKTRNYETKDEAAQFINATLRRRLSAPKRIGCPYQIISLKAIEDIPESLNQSVIGRFDWTPNHKTPNVTI